MSQAGINNIGGGGGGGSPVETLTGNNGVAVPPTANNINILGTGPITVTGNSGTSTLTISITETATTYTAITHNGTNPSPYTVTGTDYYISADTNSATAGTITILLPNAPTTLREFIIKDRTGAASINNIFVTTVGGAVTIDGQTTYTLAGNYSSIQLLFNGTSYEVF